METREPPQAWEVGPEYSLVGLGQCLDWVERGSFGKNVPCHQSQSHLVFSVGVPLGATQSLPIPLGLRVTWFSTVPNFALLLSLGIVGLSFFWEAISAIDYAPFPAKCTRELFVFLRASWELMVGRECWLGFFETDIP